MDEVKWYKKLSQFEKWKIRRLKFIVCIHKIPESAGQGEISPEKDTSILSNRADFIYKRVYE